MTVLMVALVVVLGLCVGSFLNVVAWRVPRGESVVRPPSACPGCGRQIRPAENVPVVSWLVLRARCRGCGERISAVYPAVEVATGVLFVLVFLRFGLSWELPAFLYAAAIAVALTVVDIRLHRLPDAIVLPSYVVVGVLLVVAAAAAGEWGDLVRALIGGTILLVAYFLMVLAYPAGMGLGDVKLAGILGALLGWVGWGALAVGAFGAFVLGGAFALVLVLMRRAGRGSGIPFGPWMMLGAAIGIGAGQQIFDAYLGLVL
jgi:leader peptidase (prepilin peptidase)/N-methyltransferase